MLNGFIAGLIMTCAYDFYIHITRGSKELNDKKAKLSVMALGFGIGITWGLAILIVGILATTINCGQQFIAIFASIYPGFKATIEGSLLGGFWGFIDGFIGGFLIACFYNVYLCCCHSKCKKQKSE